VLDLGFHGVSRVEVLDHVSEGVDGVIAAVFDGVGALGFVGGEAVLLEALDEVLAGGVDEECWGRAVGGLETAADEVEAGEDGGSAGVEGDFDDEMVPQAIEVIRTTKRASTSMLQRRLRIGYNRAARIMDILEEEGYVGPDNGAQPREILMED